MRKYLKRYTPFSGRNQKIYLYARRRRRTTSRPASSVIPRSVPYYYSNNPTVITQPATYRPTPLSSHDIPRYVSFLKRNGYNFDGPPTPDDPISFLIKQLKLTESVDTPFNLSGGIVIPQLTKVDNPTVSVSGYNLYVFVCLYETYHVISLVSNIDRPYDTSLDNIISGSNYIMAWQYRITYQYDNPSALPPENRFSMLTIVTEDDYHNNKNLYLALTQDGGNSRENMNVATLILRRDSYVFQRGLLQD